MSASESFVTVKRAVTKSAKYVAVPSNALRHVQDS